MTTSTTEQVPQPNGRRTTTARTETAAAPPPKRRRNPMLIAASIAAFCVCALLSVWLYTGISDTTSVVAARATIERGSVIDADDLVSVQISTDPALNPISSAKVDSVVGKRASTDIPGGGLVTSASIIDTVVPVAGQSVIGLSLAPGQMPGTPLHNGDRARVVATPGEAGDVESGDQITIAVTVVTVGKAGVDGQKVVDVAVPDKAAAEVAARAATGRLALVLDSRAR